MYFLEERTPGTHSNPTWLVVLHSSSRWSQFYVPTCFMCPTPAHLGDRCKGKEEDFSTGSGITKLTKMYTETPPTRYSQLRKIKNAFPTSQPFFISTFHTFLFSPLIPFLMIILSSSSPPARDHQEDALWEGIFRFLVLCEDSESPRALLVHWFGSSGYILNGRCCRSKDG